MTCGKAECLAVHPRACGERVDAWIGSLVLTGSSPRLRGTLCWRRVPVLQKRFIPAPAGNAVGQWTTHKIEAVHPRACGERLTPSISNSTQGGSSPRLRGTPIGFEEEQIVRRFIPAPAGNARRGALELGERAVHPRACGERSVCWFSRASRSGSSPRLRGTRRPAAGAPMLGRFIPAPAGNAERQWK